jgi:UDP-N-acetylmuramoylalanine--D-glutamate ligase
VKALLVGLAETNASVARHLLARGDTAVLVDDRPSDATRARADELGLELVAAPGPGTLRDLVQHADVVVPTPGVPFAHPARAAAADAGVPVWSEFELAAQWGIAAPVVAITGTNGKTTVTAMVTAMLEAAGKRAVAAGNNQPVALVEAAAGDADVIVVEAPSFRLADVDRFRADVGVWLNLAEDHLDWHPSMAHYIASKARVWANQGPDDTAVANAEDPVVSEQVAGARGRIALFGVDAGDWHTAGGVLLSPDGDEIVEIARLPRPFPHEIANGLAATAAAVAAGATLDDCRGVLETFRSLPHRIELVGDAGGVRYYDDSKATTPASVLAAVSGFDSVVLIAGGRNAGMDLSVLRSLAPHLRAVVAIGDAADEVAAVFDGARPVTAASSMDEAVAAAAALAEPGDAVLLSPGCKSFDWYSGYAERGDDFARAVRDLVGAA